MHVHVVLDLVLYGQSTCVLFIQPEAINRCFFFRTLYEGPEMNE